MRLSSSPQAVRFSVRITLSISPCACLTLCMCRHVQRACDAPASRQRAILRIASTSSPPSLHPFLSLPLSLSLSLPLLISLLRLLHLCNGSKTRVWERALVDGEVLQIRQCLAGSREQPLPRQAREVLQMTERERERETDTHTHVQRDTWRCCR